MNFLLLPPRPANSRRKLLALSGYPNERLSSLRSATSAFALMSCVWLLSRALFVYRLVKGVIMSNSGKLRHLSARASERTGDGAFPERRRFLFCLCFVFRSLELNCPQQRRYSSRDSVSQKISLERSRVSRLAFVCARVRARVYARRGPTCLCVWVFMRA